MKFSFSAFSVRPYISCGQKQTALLTQEGTDSSADWLWNMMEIN